MIDEHGEYILHDFQHHYGLDFVQVMKPGSGYTPRRVLTLIKQFPPESATVAAIRGGEQFRGWGADRYLFAAMVDAIRENTYAFVSANSQKKVKEPEPVKRPDKHQQQRQNKSNPFAAMAAQRIAAVRQARGG